MEGQNGKVTEVLQICPQLRMGRIETGQGCLEETTKEPSEVDQRNGPHEAQEITAQPVDKKRQRC